MKRIKYMSEFSEELTWLEIDELGKRAATKNQSLDVTGVLVVAGGIFYQVLEGPEEAVDHLFATIRADPRHQNVLLLAEQLGVSQRLFPEWGMRSFVLDADIDMRLRPLREIFTTIFEQSKQIERLSATLDRTIWEEYRSKSTA